MNTEAKIAAVKANIEKNRAKKVAEKASKALVDKSNGVDRRVMTNFLTEAFENNPVLAKVLKVAAKKYSELNPHVDLRMQAGKAMLEAIAADETETLAVDAMRLSVEVIPAYVYVSESDKEISTLASELATIASQSDEAIEVVGETLADAIHRNHPTLSQSFLACVRNAALSVEENDEYVMLGNAYKDAIPYV